MTSIQLRTNLHGRKDLLPVPFIRENVENVQCHLPLKGYINARIADYLAPLCCTRVQKAKPVFALPGYLQLKLMIYSNSIEANQTRGRELITFKTQLGYTSRLTQYVYHVNKSMQ